MVRFSHGVAAVSLILLLCSSALAYDFDMDDDFCDPQEETQTEQFAILWKEEPYDVEDFFKDKDIKLEWSADWDWDEENIWSVYEAKTVKAANGIMRDIQRVIDGEDVEDDSEYSEGNPMSDPDVAKGLKAHIAGVFGTCLQTEDASHPAALPTECDGTPPAPVCPNDGLWGLNRINAPAVWRVLPGVVNSAPSESVMVIDSGVRRTHQDLAGNLVNRLTVEGYGGSIRLLSDTTTPSRAPAAVSADVPFYLRHGTHVSGTVFGAWNNGRGSAAGVVGRALGGSCGCAIPFTNAQGQRESRLDNVCLITCIAYAASQGVRVINLSWGGVEAPRRLDRPDPQRDAIVRFCNSGGLIVTSAGNGEGNPRRGINVIRPDRFKYPSAYAQQLAATIPTCIINVANMQEDGSLAVDSNFGNIVQVAAPGTNILSSVAASDTATGELSGTSMATPHVAGMAALLFNEFPGATQAQVYRCIVTTAARPVTANPLVPGQTIGGGLVDLEAAFECMRGRAECPTRGLPPCVDPRSGQAVTSCETDRFCLNIRSRRFVCQYSYRPNGFLCRSRNTTIVRTAGLDLDGVELVRLSAEELTTMGLDAEPSAELMSEGEEEVAASVLGGIEVQQGTRRTKTRRTKRKVVTCGQCRNRACETVTGALCTAARQQVVVRAR